MNISATAMNGPLDFWMKRLKIKQNKVGFQSTNESHFGKEYLLVYI